jgi:biopolymer transport protein ExbB
MKLTRRPIVLSRGSQHLATKIVSAVLIVLAICLSIAIPDANAQQRSEATQQGETQDSEAQTNAVEPTTWQQFTSFVASAVTGTAGKVFVLTLLAIICFSLAIIGDRVYFLYYYLGKNGKYLAKSIEGLIGDGKLDEARYEARSKKKSPLGDIFYTMLDPETRSLPPDEFSAVLQNKSLRAADLIKRNLPHLHMLANVATLVGLLGTIVGLILAFGVIANLPAAQRAHELTNSISLAMSTTAFGLIVAIPNLILYSVFSEAASNRISMVEESVNRIQSKLDQVAGTQPAA